MSHRSGVMWDGSSSGFAVPNLFKAMLPTQHSNETGIERPHRSIGRILYKNDCFSALAIADVCKFVLMVHYFH